MAIRNKKFSIYDAEGNVSEDAEKIIDEVFYDYPAFSERMNACRKLIWDTLLDDNMSKEDFTEHCKYTRQFDIEEEGPLDGSEDNEEESDTLPQLPTDENLLADDDPRLLLMAYWLQQFESSMDPWPKKKANQAEWKAMYGNFYWVAGQAIMKLHEEGCPIVEWETFDAQTLAICAENFANTAYTSFVEPILSENNESK
jgi:hypothetical protein